MIKLSNVIVSLGLAAAVNANAGSVDWGVCSVDLEKTGCGIGNDDHEKHECLEKKGKKVVSEKCLVHNKELEKHFKGEHKGAHKH